MSSRKLVIPNIAEIADHYNAGERLSDLAKELGVDRGGIRRGGKAFGLTRALMDIGVDIRRRTTEGVHPVADENNYTDDEREFLVAVDKWKRSRGKKFMTVTEVLGVVKALGYHK